MSLRLTCFLRLNFVKSSPTFHELNMYEWHDILQYPTPEHKTNTFSSFSKMLKVLKLLLCWKPDKIPISKNKLQKIVLFDVWRRVADRINKYEKVSSLFT